MKQRGMIVGVGLGLLVVALSGCGSGGAGSNTAQIASPFAGHWAGPWSDSNGKSGTLDVVVGTDGRMTGTVVDTSDSMNGSVTGTSTNAGQFNATETYPGPVTVGISGTVSLGTNGHLAGQVQMSQSGNTTGSGSFDLAKQ